MDVSSDSGRFRLPPRYRKSQDDERDDAQLTKVIYQTVVYPGSKSYIPPSYDQTQRTVRPAFQVQYHHNHPGQQRSAADGPSNWSSWTSGATGGASDVTDWRRPYRIEPRGFSTSMRRPNMGNSLYNGMPAPTFRHEATMTARQRHSNASTTHTTVNMADMDISRYRTSQRSDPSVASISRRPPEIIRKGTVMHPHFSYATFAPQATQNPTSTSMLQQRPSNSEIGWHHRIGNAYKYHTVEPPANHESFSSPSAEGSKKLPSISREANVVVPLPTEEAQYTNPATSHNEKRVLSPANPNAQATQFKRAKGFDKLDLLCTATLEIGEMHDNPTGCSCPKSKCVALYCDCFKAGRRCHPDRCSCLDCKNTIAESGVDGARTKAIRSILARNPRAFNTAGMGNPLHKLPPGEIACNCVHSRCLKLYCSCFHNGKLCNPSICTCVRCGNSTDASGDRLAAIQHAMEKRADAFVIKPKVIGQGCACKNNRCLRKYCECFRTELQCTAKCRCRECENRGVEQSNSSGNNNEILQQATTISTNSSDSP